MMPNITRRAVVALGLLMAVPALPAAAATNPAEQFIADNIHKGFDLLNNKSLSPVQRRAQFEQFLLGIADMKRIAVFTLGNYRRSASPADLEAFDTAFQNYAVSVYQSYFSKYAGQSLKVTGSQVRSADDVVVQTQLIDPNDRSGQPPVEVDFRVRTDTGRPVVTDVAYSGIWLALEERDQFTAFLGQNGGNLRTLVNHLNELARQYK